MSYSSNCIKGSKVYIKLMAVGLMILIGIYLVFNNTTTQQNISILQENKQENKDVYQYKDIFKENTQISEFKKLQESNKLKALDLESEKIIAEAELRIKNNNLVVPHKELSNNDKEKLQKMNEELKKAQQKLEELSHEN
jgi:ABC-type maltose transport system permease subunit